ncbi:hypothetical protein [Bdellovibrio sp. HCB2-146]|uniref:hypothetical protein n=1 Tax=Bdellovibrio sp. HCB2-146 TaxID=3394362 RepID=UPI0039BC62C2
MTTLTRLTVMSFAIGFYVGCSPVNFGLDTSKCNDMDTTCVVENGKFKITETITAGSGKVDILIVNDNSASMSFEQRRLAPRFQNFINNLDAKKIDYRIAMTTTDITSQGGKLIPFGSNPYLTPKVADRLALFQTTIQRPETRQCENFIANWIASKGIGSINTTAYQQQYAANCPSGDERGVYAANTVIKTNPSSFLRPEAHFAIIFLSDEDERSGLYSSGGSALESMDQPATLLSNVKSILGNEKYNSLSVHAIVVRDSTCLAQQNNQVLGDTPVEATRGLVQGSIGTVYLAFTKTSPAWGVSADICSENYTGQLGEIQARIENRLKDVILRCDGAEGLTVSGSSVAYHLEGKTLKFDQYLAPGTSITLNYTCTNL